MITGKLSWAIFFLLAVMTRPLSGQELIRRLPDYFPWLRDRSTFSFATNLAKGPPPIEKRGAFPVGNGEVFATLGLVGPPGSLSHIQSFLPHAGINLGQSCVDFQMEGKSLNPEHWGIATIRRCGMIETSLRYKGARVLIVDAAPPGLSAILRLIAVRNTSREPLTGARLNLTYKPNEESKVSATDLPSVEIAASIVNLGSSSTPHQNGTLRSAAPGSAGDQTLQVQLPQIAAGEESYVAVWLHLGTEHRQETLERFERFGAHGILDMTYGWWRRYLGGRTEVLTQDPRIADLLDRCFVHLGILRAGRSGPFLSPLNHPGVRSLDQLGPVRALVSAGDRTSASRAVEGIFRAACAEQAILNEYPVASVLANAPIPDAFAIDQEHLSLESAFTNVILHDLVFRDELFGPLVFDRWQYLLANVSSILDENSRRLPGPSTELAATPAELNALLLTDPEMARRHVPHGNGRRPRLLEQELLRAMANDAMKSLYELLDFSAPDPHQFISVSTELRRAINTDFLLSRKGLYAPAASPLQGEKHPVPTALSSLAIIWHRFSSTPSNNILSSLDRSLDLLVTPQEKQGGLILRSFPGSSTIEGESLGRLLFVLASVGHPLAGPALETVLTSASPSGGISRQYHAGDLTPLADPTLRLDPAAIGVTLEAILNYFAPILRLSTDTVYVTPNIPSGFSSVALNDLNIAGNKAQLNLYQEPEKITYELTMDGGNPITLGLVVRTPSTMVRDFRVNGRGANTLIHFSPDTYFGRKGILFLEDDLVPGEPLVLETMFQRSQIPIWSYLQSSNQPLLWPGRTTSPASTVLFACRMEHLDLAPPGRVRVVDVGLPMLPETLATTFLDPTDKKPICRKLIIPSSVRTPDSTNLKTEAFWKDEALLRAFKDFEEAGGTIVEIQ